MTTRTPRRRLDVEQRRASILDAARARYADAPYDAVSVADVAADAGASQALVFHYFGSKAGLYAEVVRGAVAALLEAQRAADAALPRGVPARDRVRRALETHLDHVAAHPGSWATALRGGSEPAEAHAVRAAARARTVELLSGLLGLHGLPRHEYAVTGYLGFVDHACLRWVDGGCRADERGPLLDAALGALEGALGDWGV